VVAVEEAAGPGNPSFGLIGAPSRADTRSMRLASAAVALCAALTLAAGCGSGTERVSLETIEKAAYTTESVRTARVSFKGDVTFNHDHAQRFEFKGRGVVDWTTGSADMSAVYKFPDPIQSAIKHQFGGPLKAHMILDGREGIVLYMRFPFLDGVLPHGKTWLKADIVRLGKRYGLDLDRLKETKQSDPGLMLDYVKSAVGVRRVGADLVRREVTTHYSTVVKAETIVKQAPRDEQRAMRKFLRLYGIKTYPVDMWVDRNGVVRKLAIELEYKQPRGDYVKMELSEEYYDLGANVEIEPPPAKRVLDVTKRLDSRERPAHAPRSLSS
jgi:hypothetical protein